MSSSFLMQAQDLVLRDSAKRKIAGPIDLSLQPGQCLVIRGPNGSGKTTLLRTLAGQHEFFSGNLALNIEPKRLAYLPQLANVRFHLPLTLRDVLSIGSSGGHPGLSDEQIAAKTREIGLLDPSALDRDWNSASGGERQRALITRLFLMDPQVIVLDEPANHLDVGSRRALMHLLERFVSEAPKQRALVIVTHEHELALPLEMSQIQLAETES